MKQVKIIIASLAILAIKCKAEIETPVVSIIGPRVIRQGKPYSVAASTHALKKPVMIDVKLSGTEDKTNHYIEHNIVDTKVPTDQLKHFEFDTENFNPGKYELVVTITDPMKKKDYVQSLPLTFSRTHFSFLIQCDKPIYRGGDVVNFRVFAIDSETKAYNPESAVVTILDPSSNNVKTIEKITFVKGKFEGSFLLSDVTPKGSWILRVSAEAETFDKYFNVDDYVRPLYSLDIENPPQVAVTETSFTIKITPVYTFGKSVEGDALVTISQQRYWWDWPRGSSEEILFTTTVHIASESETVEVRIKDDLKLTSDNGYMYLTINVKFTSSLTGESTQESSSISIVPFAYSIVITGDPIFTANTNYEATVSVRKFDGRTAPAGTSVSVQYYLYSNCIYTNGIFNCPSKTLPTQTYQTDVTGSVVVSVNPENFEYMSIQASCPISDMGYFYVSKERDLYENVLEAKVLTKEPKIDSRLEIQVTTSLSELDFVNYNVIAKGVMLESKRIALKDRSGILRFKPDFRYAPQAVIIFFFHDPFGVLVSTQIYLSFSDVLPNFLDLDLSVETTEPGKNVSLCVSSSINSRASLLAIDQSILMLGSGNDIEKSDITNTMWKYSYNQNPDYQAPQDELQFEYIGLAVIKFLLEGYPKPETTTTTSSTTTAPESGGGPTMTSDASSSFEMLPGPTLVDQSSFAEPELTTSNRNPIVSPPSKPPRKNFAEVFLYRDVDIINPKKKGSKGYKGEECISFTAPDQITSYVISGVSMSCDRGMGLALEKPKLTVFLPFFVEVTTPNNMKRGEVLEQPILIFNYLKSQKAVVSLKRNDAQFEILDPKLNGWTVESDRIWQVVQSEKDKQNALDVVIRPRVLGYLELAIEAKGSAAVDSIVKKIKIIPEGVPKSITNSTLFQKIDTDSDITTILSCTLPSSAVADTTSAAATVAGDMLGDTLSNLQNLIQMSYGCGEQNLINFVPNVVVLNYLDKTGQLTPDVRARAIDYGEQGYQRQLQYRRFDGSFSAFGNDDATGSTWLTSYVIKSFGFASPYISVDPNVISTANDYLLTKQNLDGSFREDGNVIHKDLQGGSGSGIAMTCYIVTVLLEGVATYPQYQDAIDNALNFISEYPELTDVYDLAICSYALQIGKHSKFNDFFTAFDALKIETADTIHFEKPLQAQDQNSWSYYSQPRSVDIEITAYACQIYVNNIADDIDSSMLKATKTAKYLVSQKTALGGLASSQDTVVGITALAAYSIAFHSAAGTLDFELTPDIGNVITAQVNPDNVLALQKYDLNPLARALTVYCSKASKGSAIVSLTCNFYEIEDESAPRFIITHNLGRSCKALLRSRICINYVARGDDKDSNMALMTMTFPSGYKFNNIDKVYEKLEKENDDTLINVYFNKFNADGICFEVSAVQTNVIKKLKASYILVKDYYDTVKKAQIFFGIPEDLPDCKDLPPDEEKTTPTPDTSSTDKIIIRPPIRPLPVEA